MSFAFRRRADQHTADRSQAEDQQLVEALDACRSGSHDIDEPELALFASKMAADAGLANRYHRMQALDARIATAFQNVPVAEDLADRLLFRLADEKPRRSLSRRRWFAAALTAVAASLLAAVWLESCNPKPLPEPYVLSEAIRYFGASPPESLQPSNAPPPAAYPVSRALAQCANLHWWAINDFLGWNGVAYDLSGSGETRATLYVVAGSVDGVASSPAWQPFSTGGCSVSTWQENGLLYVLVVQGTPSTYQRFLQQPSGPIA